MHILLNTIGELMVKGKIVYLFANKKLRMKSVFIFILSMLCYGNSKAQVTIKIGEYTTRINAKDEVTYSYPFKEGDELILELEVLNGKEVRLVEFGRVGVSRIYTDYRVKKIENKRITIQKSGSHQLRIKNTSTGKRVCNVKILRILKNEEISLHDPNVLWRTYFDTTYYTVQEKYLIRSDTQISNITDQISKVHSKGNTNGNKLTFNFSLPPNTIAWSYYIGVDQEGEKAFQNAVANLSKAVTPVISKIPNYGPLAALALGGASFLTVLNTGEDINYYIVSPGNETKFIKKQDFKYIKKGSVINDFSRMLAPLKGSYHVCLQNDNTLKSVSVTVKIVAITVNQDWGERSITKMKVNSRQEPYMKP